MATSRCGPRYLGINVLSFEQRHTSVSTDFSHGLGEILVGHGGQDPRGQLPGLLARRLRATQSVPYNFGITDQLLNEVDMGFNTGSMRNIYSPDCHAPRS